jgi:hypothetical protein
VPHVRCHRRASDLRSDAMPLESDLTGILCMLDWMALGSSSMSVERVTRSAAQKEKGQRSPEKPLCHLSSTNTLPFSRRAGLFAYTRSNDEYSQITTVVGVGPENSLQTAHFVLVYFSEFNSRRLSCRCRPRIIALDSIFCWQLYQYRPCLSLSYAPPSDFRR